jgi:hypothetical protein
MSMYLFFVLAGATIAAATVALGSKVENDEPISLKGLNIRSLTVSGLSSGAYMAVQFHISHSKAVNGSAIFAGGPFYCAESNLEFAQHKCMDNEMGFPNVGSLVALTREDYLLGFVDNPDAHLKHNKVYLFSGKDDSVVKPPVVKALYDYYSAFVAPSNIVAEFNEAAEHCLPTLDYGEECDTLASPYLGKCNFDGAEHAFRQLYGADTDMVGGGFQAAVTQDERTSTWLDSNLFAFDQTEYFLNDGLNSIGDVGYIYIPTNCQNGAKQCSLHVSFHGCEQNLELIGNEYAKNAGFNVYAEKNDIVVLYPYVKVSELVPYNPKGCWDWWAYSGIYYGTKKGVQVEFVRKIIQRLGFDAF